MEYSETIAVISVVFPDFMFIQLPAPLTFHLTCTGDGRMTSRRFRPIRLAWCLPTTTSMAAVSLQSLPQQIPTRTCNIRVVALRASHMAYVYSPVSECYTLWSTSTSLCLLSLTP